MNITEHDTDTRIDNFLGNPHKTILFNDEHHSTIEVTEQIIKAIHCATGRAAEIMMTALQRLFSQAVRRDASMSPPFWNKSD